MLDVVRIPTVSRAPESCQTSGMTRSEGAGTARPTSRLSNPDNGLISHLGKSDGVSVDGPAVEGVEVVGAAVDGSAVDGVAVEGVSVNGAAVEGVAVDGVAVEGVSKPREVQGCARVVQTGTRVELQGWY